MAPVAVLLLGALLPVVLCQGDEKPWHEGLQNVLVFGPDDKPGEVLKALYQNQTGMNARPDAGKISGGMRAVLPPVRHAVLLKSGDYGDLDVGVGTYTSVAGVGLSRAAVKVRSFHSNDLSIDGDVGAMKNFWRSVEGLTASGSVVWATSQGCPLRRLAIEGDLHLSEEGRSNGGFSADIVVGGRWLAGTQTQYFTRNSHLTDGEYPGSFNFVYVGVEGAPARAPGTVSVREAAPLIAEKPYLVEEDGLWFIAVPPVQKDARGSSVSTSDTGYLAALIPMSDVYVAKPGESAAQINKGIERKRGLLLTPGVYELKESIVIRSVNFVVLGIGFPTLLAKTTASALSVQHEALNVRIAGVVLQAGSASSSITSPLLMWTGNWGVASDIYTRAGNSYDCLQVRADVHVQIDGHSVIFDNTWLWHDNTEPCAINSDAEKDCLASYSGNGLVVNGHSVTVYGLAVGHMMKDLVSWVGNAGRTFFFHSEIQDDGCAASGRVGYKVDHGVEIHEGLGLGVSSWRGTMMPSGFQAPRVANLQNIFVVATGGVKNHFGSVICTSDGPDASGCFQGDQCFEHTCYLMELRVAVKAAADTSSRHQVLL